jgi:hypothetical protein
MKKLLALGIFLLNAHCWAAPKVVFAEVTQREEIWDRRSNPLMGRPDFLVEVRLTLSGKAPLQVSAKGKSLQAARKAQKGVRGTFQLESKGPNWELLSFEPDPTQVIQAPTPAAAPMPKAVPTPPFPENLSSSELKASLALQKRAMRAITQRYHFNGAKIIFLSSHQGPMPPKGGYQFWGITGKIQGKPHVWQPGYGKPRPGSTLYNPHEHQK